MAERHFVLHQLRHLDAKIRLPRKILGSEHIPTVSSPRLVLANPGSSFTASHASANLSCTGLLASIISGGGTMGRAVTKTVGSGGRGIGKGISRTPLWGVRSSLGDIDVKGDVVVCPDRLK